MRFEPSTYKRCICEGHDARQAKGYRLQCPYNGDDRAGAFNFGAQKAKEGYSISRTWELFKRMEGI